jgi:hypothetical protein
MHIAFILFQWFKVFIITAHGSLKVAAKISHLKLLQSGCLPYYLVAIDFSNCMKDDHKEICD